MVVSSTNALRVNTSNLVYDSSKAALNHMARALALELKSEGVRVNTVMPGGVDTPMLSRWLGDYAGSPAAAKKVLEDGISSGAVGTPDDIASAILSSLRRCTLGHWSPIGCRRWRISQRLGFSIQLFAQHHGGAGQSQLAPFRYPEL